MQRKDLVWVEPSVSRRAQRAATRYQVRIAKDLYESQLQHYINRRLGESALCFPQWDMGVTTFSEPRKGSMFESLTRLAKKYLPGNAQVFRKAGWLTDDLEFTPTGRDAILIYIFTMYEKELVEIAKAEIKEAKDE